MAASFPQQSRLRKLTYFGLIVGLFFVTLILRKQIVEPRASALELREENLGEVELTGSALRLSLTGSRGIAVCYLWVVADNMKKRHEWNELELVVNSIIKLQPHFIEPWLFQSWNLAYNVSVEADHPRDKYFYITRGIELLAEGERRNRDNPDLRLNMGFYYQNKLGISDENNYFRCLFQMSCIDPVERDPQRFGKLNAIDMGEFRDFCEKYPTLVRRMRDRLGKDQPYKVVEFLEENRRLPTLYDESVKAAQTPKKAPDKRFPVLPPKSNARTDEFTAESVLPDNFDNFLASRTWMAYAQEPYDDPAMRRPPRKPALLIFLSYPARAQAYYAERLEKEGWFDHDGWVVTDWFSQPIAFGKDRLWAAEAWGKAFEMYQDYGEKRGLYKTPEQLASMSTDDRQEYEYGNRLTNFQHFYYQTEVEKEKDAVTARKFFFLADKARKTPRKAVELYRNPAAFGSPETWFGPKGSWKPSGWKKILAEHDNFRRDSTVQEESYESQLKYLDSERQLSDGINEQLRWLNVIQSGTPYSAAWPNAASALVPAAVLAADLPIVIRGPLDDVHPRDLEPYLSPGAKESVNQRLRSLGLGRKIAPSPNTPAPSK
jgi:hypothetical protein